MRSQRRTMRGLSSLLLLAVVHTSPWASATSEPPHKDYVLDTWQSLSLFEESSRRELLKALKAVPWQERKLAAQPSLLMTSGQSLDPDGKRVLNRIQLFERKRFDIWVMKQAVSGHGFDYRKWNRVVIAVDKQARPFKAYYFQFGQQTLGERGLPSFKAPTAACLTCHSSGPRLIRPELGADRAKWTPEFSKRQQTLLEKWNWKIQGYREVADHEATWEGQSLVRWNQPGDQEILRHPSCIECHSAGSGVRAPLRRENADSIRYLVKQGEMPLEGHMLSKQEAAELERWIDQRTR